MNTADRIQQLRKAKGISQEELADKIGVSRQAVSKWESEQSLPDIDKIILLSDYFAVTTDYLLKGIELIPEKENKIINPKIFSIIATTLNAVGLLVSILLWFAWQEATAVLIAFIIMAIGCGIFFIGKAITASSSTVTIYFVAINIWFWALPLVSSLSSLLQGTFGRFSVTLSPIPLLQNSIILYLFTWVIYFVICLFNTLFLLKKYKSK